MPYIEETKDVLRITIKLINHSCSQFFFFFFCWEDSCSQILSLIISFFTLISNYAIMIWCLYLISLIFSFFLFLGWISYFIPYVYTWTCWPSGGSKWAFLAWRLHFQDMHELQSQMAWMYCILVQPSCQKNKTKTRKDLNQQFNNSYWNYNIAIYTFKNLIIQINNLY